jgi:hypothetical protein
MLVPQAQLDALPSASQPNYVAQGGEVEVMPVCFMRYYSPAAAGMDGLVGNASDPVTFRFRAYSGRMNVRGVRRFTFTLAVKMREAASDSDFRPDVYATAWVDDGPGVSYAPLQDNFNVNTWVKVGTLRLAIAYVASPFPPPVMGVYPTIYKTAACSWDVGGMGNAGVNQDGLTGTIALRLDAVAGIPGGAVYNAFLYGSLLATS